MIVVYNKQSIHMYIRTYVYVPLNTFLNDYSIISIYVYTYVFEYIIFKLRM